MAEGILQWVPSSREGPLFVATTGTGHSLVLGSKERGCAISPEDLLALSLGACTATEVVTILKKKHKELTSYEARVEADTKLGPPAVFTAIRVHHRIRGHGVDAASVQHAIDLSQHKYCAIGVMLDQIAPVDHTFEILEESATV
jgi:putative redox protein